MLQQLFCPGWLVRYELDLEPRVYRVKSATFKNGDWWYKFHKTGQGGLNESEPELPQGSLYRVNTKGDIWGS